MKLPDLQEQRGFKLAEMRGILDAAEAANRDLGDIERARYDTLAKELGALEQRIADKAKLTEFERRAEAKPVRGGAAEMASIESRYSIAKAVTDLFDRGALTGAEAEFAAEHRSGRNGAFAVPAALLLERRTQTVGTASEGGHLVPTNVGPVADRLRPRLAVQSLGATVFSGLTGFLDLPILSSSGSTTWVAEDGDATRSAAAFVKRSMSPKTVTAEYQISRRAQLQATALEGLLRSDMGFLLAQGLDSAAIKGGGTNEPSGIIANGGVGVTALGTDGAAFSMDAARDMIGAVDIADVTAPTAFLTNAKVRKAVSKLADTTNRPFGVETVFADQPVTFSNQVPSNLTKGSGTNLSAVIYGAWSELVIGYWSAVDILANPYHADVASNGGLLLHAFLDCDIVVRHPEGFVVCKDVIA